MRQVIRADLNLARRPARRPRRGRSRAARDGAARAKRTSAKTPEQASLSAAGAGPVVGAGERKGRGGRSAVRRRRRPRSARRLPAPRPARRRGAARAPGASERRRLRQDPAPQRRRRRAARPALRRRRRARARGEAAQLWRDLAGRPPSLDPGRLAAAAARLDLALPDPNGLASSLKACAGEGDPVSAAAKAAALAFSVFPDAPAAEAEILALWVFDLALAIRLRWPRPVPLIATKILDPALRSDGGAAAKAGRPSLVERRRRRDRARRRLRPRPRRRSSRRSDTLIAVAPKLRAKPAAKIVDLLLAEDCVSPAEAARHAPMTDRAARRLFDRLVALGAAREFSGRPAFRLYGL